MPNKQDRLQRTLSWIGFCLLAIQETEDALAFAVETVLGHPDLKLMEQTEFEQRKTLGILLKKLKRRAKLDLKLKDRLYHFLDMRNTFVHNLAEVPGWNLDTEEGQQVALKFVGELTFTSLGLTMLFRTLMHVSSKDDYGTDLFEDEDETTRKIIANLEKRFGPTAREILAGRYRKPGLVHSRMPD